MFWVLVAILAVGTGLMYWGAYQTRFDLSNIDGISYISITHHYVDGHLDAAVNAYWSPLISWLMAPLVAMGVTDILAFGLVSATAAVVAAAIGTWIVWRWTNRNFLLSVIVLVSLLLFGIGNLPQITPDMIVVAWVLGFAASLIWIDHHLEDFTTKGRIGAGILIGAVGVIGYLTKLYLVPVFVVTLALWWLVRFVLARRSSRAEGRQAGRGAAVLLAIAAGVAVVLALPWVIALSAKYGYPTIGSSFSVNVDAKFEPSAAASPNPSVTPEPRPTILHAPPNQYATSFGEDRTFQVDQGPKSDASVLERARYYVAERFAAFPYYLERIVSIAPFALLAIIGLGLAIIFGRIKYRENAPALMVGLLWSVYFLGYAAITSAASGGGNLRYYWPLFALSLVMIALLVPTIWKALAPGPRWRKIVVAVLLAVVPFAVYWQHGLNRPGIFSSSSPSSNLSYLFTTPTPPVDRVFAEEELADIIPPGSKIAGSAYRPTVKYGYYLQAQVYGRSDQGYDALDPSFQELLRETGIEYYLDYTPSGGVRADLSELGETVGEYVTPQVCVDDKGAPVDESCQISVIRVSR